MRSSKLFDSLQNLINYKPSQADIAKILGLKPSAIGNRVARDAEFKEDELYLIETHYGIVGQLMAIDNKVVELDYYPNIFASCGLGTIVFDETSEKLPVSINQIPNYSKGYKYSIISARGSSMSPKIEDNDRLIVKHWAGEQIIDEHVYIFKYKDELFIKRLVKNVDQVICISENPRFQDRILTDLKDFCIVGEIIGLFRERI